MSAPLSFRQLQYRWFGRFEQGGNDFGTRSVSLQIGRGANCVGHEKGAPHSLALISGLGEEALTHRLEILRQWHST